MPSADNPFNERKDLVLSQWNIMELHLALTQELARSVQQNCEIKTL